MSYSRNMSNPKMFLEIKGADPSDPTESIYFNVESVTLPDIPVCASAGKLTINIGRRLSRGYCSSNDGSKTLSINSLGRLKDDISNVRRDFKDEEIACVFKKLAIQLLQDNSIRAPFPEKILDAPANANVWVAQKADVVLTMLIAALEEAHGAGAVPPSLRDCATVLYGHVVLY